MSRARDKIIAAASERGYTVAELEWEPIGRAAEKEGPSGGWWGRVEPDPSPRGSTGLDWFGGYSWQEAVKFIEDFFPRVAPPSCPVCKAEMIPAADSYICVAGCGFPWGQEQAVGAGTESA